MNKREMNQRRVGGEWKKAQKIDGQTAKKDKKIGVKRGEDLNLAAYSFWIHKNLH